MTTISSRVSVPNLRRLSSRKVYLKRPSTCKQYKWFTVFLAKLFRYPKRKWGFFPSFPFVVAPAGQRNLPPYPFCRSHVLFCLGLGYLEHTTITTTRTRTWRPSSLFCEPCLELGGLYQIAWKANKMWNFRKFSSSSASLFSIDQRQNFKRSIQLEEEENICLVMPSTLLDRPWSGLIHYYPAPFFYFESSKVTCFIEDVASRLA